MKIVEFEELMNKVEKVVALLKKQNQDTDIISIIDEMYRFFVERHTHMFVEERLTQIIKRMFPERGSKNKPWILDREGLRSYELRVHDMVNDVILENWWNNGDTYEAVVSIENWESETNEYTVTIPSEWVWKIEDIVTYIDHLCNEQHKTYFNGQLNNEY